MGGGGEGIASSLKIANLEIETGGGEVQICLLTALNACAFLAARRDSWPTFQNETKCEINGTVLYVV